VCGSEVKSSRNEEDVQDILNKLRESAAISLRIIFICVNVNVCVCECVRNINIKWQSCPESPPFVCRGSEEEGDCGRDVSCIRGCMGEVSAYSSSLI